jgi:hypothetical protein
VVDCRGIGVMMMKIFTLAVRGGGPSEYRGNERNGELRRVSSGNDGRAHDVSHRNGRGLAGGTMPIPHPRSDFFEQSQFERSISNDFSQLLGLPTPIVDFTGRRRPLRGVGETPLAGFGELFRPRVIQALGDAFPPAQRGNAMFAAQTSRAQCGFSLRPSNANASPGGCLSQSRSDDGFGLPDFWLIFTP